MATKPAVRPSMLTQAEVAEEMRSTVKTVSRWIDRGDLPVHRFGRLKRIALDDLAAFTAMRRLR